MIVTTRTTLTPQQRARMRAEGGLGWGWDHAHCPAPAIPTHATLYHVTTGERIDRWIVDARELLATGEWTTTPPAPQ